MLSVWSLILFLKENTEQVIHRVDIFAVADKYAI